MDGLAQHLISVGASIWNM